MMQLDWFDGESLLALPGWPLFAWWLVLAYAVALLIQWYFYAHYFSGIARYAKRLLRGKIAVSDQQPPVTVVITTSNQGEALSSQLPLILEQDYPEFQVVVVNDASCDETEDLLKKWSERYPHLYHTFVPPGVQNISARKLALTVGIKAAKYDYLLFTDANCVPTSNRWIASLMRHFTPETDLVLSYSRYDGVHGFWKQAMVYDNLFQAMRFLGMAACGVPYMGSGRNMAYRKELFFRQKGFASHLNLHSGEDDLFVSDVATKRNTRIEVSAEAVMNVVDRHPASAWMNTRMNQMDTAPFYRWKAKVRTGVELFTRFTVYGLLLTLLVLGICTSNLPLMLVAVLPACLRLLLQALTLSACAKTLGERSFVPFLPVYDVVLPLQALSIRVEGWFRRRRSRTAQVLH
jgi:glycosyltransferase involved in cell wall biosynthesis